MSKQYKCDGCKPECLLSVDFDDNRPSTCPYSRYTKVTANWKEIT